MHVCEFNEWIPPTRPSVMKPLLFVTQAVLVSHMGLASATGGCLGEWSTQPGLLSCPGHLHQAQRPAHLCHCGGERVRRKTSATWKQSSTNGPQLESTLMDGMVGGPSERERENKSAGWISGTDLWGNPNIWVPLAFAIWTYFTNFKRGKGGFSYSTHLRQQYLSFVADNGCSSALTVPSTRGDILKLELANTPNVAT